MEILGLKKTSSRRIRLNGRGLSFESGDGFIIRNYSNFLMSQRPTRVMVYENAEWRDFPQDVMVPLSDAFIAKRTTVIISMGNHLFFFDFVRMVVTNLNTGVNRPFAWIDEQGSCFFPENWLYDNNDEMMSSNSDEIELKLRIRIVGTDNSEPPEEEHEATSNARLVEIKAAVVTENATSMTAPSVLSFDRLGQSLVRMERGHRDYKIVEEMFLTGSGGSVATPLDVLDIHRFVPKDGAAQARCQKFEEQIKKTMEERRGDANVRCAWHGTSKEGVVGILRNGFGRPSVGLGLEMSYGPGVYLAPQHCSHVSLKSCDVDEDGLQHMVLCRVIMGRMEQVQPGFEHFHPSSEDFDSGVDDIQNPRRYVICNTHMNTHIQAEYLVSFKLSPSQREHLAGLKNACSNVDVSMTSDQQSNSTSNLGSSFGTRKGAVPKVSQRTGISPAVRKLDYSDEVVPVDAITSSLSLVTGFASPSVPVVDDIFTTPINAPPEMSIVVHTPNLDINTLVWRIKRLHHERKIPRYFEDYDYSLERLEYVLTDEQLTLLEGFLGFYAKRPDELDIYCTLVSGKALKKVLDESTWLDTNIMYWWFEVIKSRYPDVIFYDLSVCSWWDNNNIKALQENVFGRDGIRVWEAREKSMLIFILWHESHFTLLVGHIEERRWEFYNSMKTDRTSFKYCKGFIDFLGDQFSNYGWHGTNLWSLLVKTKIPYQENGNDCGVFALAFAEHCAARKDINFKQSDIMYFRSKIVVDIYGYSWEINSHRLNIDPLTQ